MNTITVDISHALTLEGWMSDSELQWLAERAQEHKSIVEIGSFLGRSTSALAANTDGIVYALDDWHGPRDKTVQVQEWREKVGDAFVEHGYSTFINNVSGFGNVRSMPCDHASPPEVPSPDMVFIDGSHEYSDVKRDIVYWKSKLAPGGLLCGHDYNWDGVYEAVGELLPFAKAVPNTSIWYWQASAMRTMDIVDLAKVTGLRLTTQADPPAPVTTVLPEWKYPEGTVIPKNIAVAIGLPSSGRYVPFEWGLAMSGLAVPPGTNRILLPVKGVQRDLAREGIAEKALEYGSRNILFIDDDNPPPPDTLYKLLQAIDSAPDDVAVVAGIYCTKTNPPTPLVWKKEGDGPWWRWKAGDIFPCEVIATGCMMIRASVLAKIPKPWFRDVTSVEQARELGLLDAKTKAIHFEMTDDVYFCRKVRAAGFTILAHGGVLPGHWDEQGNVYFLPDDSFPMVAR